MRLKAIIILLALLSLGTGKVETYKLEMADFGSGLCKIQVSPNKGVMWTQWYDLGELCMTFVSTTNYTGEQYTKTCLKGDLRHFLFEQVGSIGNDSVLLLSFKAGDIRLGFDAITDVCFRVSDCAGAETVICWEKDNQLNN